MANTVIVIFAYNRLSYCKTLISSILCQAKALNLSILVAIDKGTNVNLIKEQTIFVDWIESLEYRIDVVANKVNLGLKMQILSTLNRVCKEFDSFIVLEEDLSVSDTFLNELCVRLDFYRDNHQIKTINAYCNKFMESNEDYLTQFVTSWGWATWSDRWIHIITDTELIIRNVLDWNRYNFGNNYDYKLHLYWNHYGIRNTWAIFWYSTIFIQDGYALQIGRNLVENRGFMGGSGENYKKPDLTFYTEISSKRSRLLLNVDRGAADRAIVMLNMLVGRKLISLVWRYYQWVKVAFHRFKLIFKLSKIYD